MLWFIKYERTKRCYIKWQASWTVCITILKSKLAFDILKYCSIGWPRKNDIWLPQGNVSCAFGIEWPSWEPSQINCALGYWINTFLCFRELSEEKQNGTMSNQSSVCFHRYFHTQPHQAPLGHLLKWLNPADRYLIYILLFCYILKA